jgi:hypothetical protein
MGVEPVHVDKADHAPSEFDYLHEEEDAEAEEYEEGEARESANDHSIANSSSLESLKLTPKRNDR